MYVSVEASRLTFPEGAVLFRLLEGSAEIGLVAAPFCRAMELAAHYLLAELLFLGWRSAHQFRTLGPAVRATRFLAQRLFRATCSGEAGFR